MTRVTGRLQGYCVGDEALSHLEAISSRIGLSEKVREEARSVFLTAIENHLTKRLPLSTIAGASIYVACRECSVRVDLRKLAQTTHSSSTARGIHKYYKFLVQRLNIQIPDVITETKNYVFRIGFKAGKSDDSIRLASELIDLDQIRGNGTAGNHPAAVAGAALYLACIKLSETVTEEEMSDAAGVSCAAVRHSLTSLRKHLLF